MLASHLHHDMSDTVAHLIPGIAKIAFSDIVNKFDCYYGTEQCETPGNISNASHSCTFYIPRRSDIVHSFVLKIDATQNGCNSDNFCNRITMSSDNQIFFDISLADNNTAAKKTRHWPYYNNNALINKKSAVPIMWNGVYDLVNSCSNLNIILHGLHIDCSPILCAEYVYLNKSYPINQRQSTGHSSQYKTNYGLCVLEHTYLSDQHILIDTDRLVFEHELNAYTTLTHLILMFKTKHAIPRHSHPIGQLKLHYKQCIIQQYDHIDLEELNWLRCELVPPLHCINKLNTATDTFVYLVPLSREAFKHPPTCWIELRQSALTLQLYGFLNAPIPQGELHIIHDHINVRIYNHGLTCIKYMH